MMQVLMIIIACGTGNGTGCAVQTTWVQPQTCINAKAEMTGFWQAHIYIYCLTSNEGNK